MRICVRDLIQGYGSKIVLDGLNFDINSNEVVAVLGPNGSGKSTLIKTICKIKPPMSGEIIIDGTDISDIKKRDFAKIVAYVPQSTVTFGYTSVYDTVLSGRRPYADWSFTGKDISLAADAMRMMHVDQLHDSYLSNLSGGQKQRVHIARALAQDSNFFLLDEPTSSLDLKHQLDTMQIMGSLSARPERGAVIALHDMNLALNFSDRVIVLSDSKIYDQGPPDDVIDEKMIRDVYGVNADIVSDGRGKFIHPYGSIWNEI